MRISECCNRDVVVTGRDTGVIEAARLMRRHHVGSLVVVESEAGRNRPVGIVTDRDLVVEVLAQEALTAELRVDDVMSGELVTVREDALLWEALDRMRTLGIRRMPVIGEDGALVGILTLDDVIELLAEAIGSVAALIKHEIGAERRVRS